MGPVRMTMLELSMLLLNDSIKCFTFKVESTKSQLKYMSRKDPIQMFNELSILPFQIDYLLARKHTHRDSHSFSHIVIVLALALYVSLISTLSFPFLLLFII